VVIRNPLRNPVLQGGEEKRLSRIGSIPRVAKPHFTSIGYKILDTLVVRAKALSSESPGFVLFDNV
jgi:hypothetical protein